MRLIIAAVIALAVTWWPSEASAQTVTPAMTVDEVSVTSTTIRVTGVVQGDATATSRWIQFAVAPTAQDLAVREECHRLLLLALSKPGQYLARIGFGECTVLVARP